MAKGVDMGAVVMHNVVSVDGYIADEADQVGPLFDWYFNGDIALTEGGGFKVSRASAAYVRPMWDSIGSMVIGRHLFDLTNGWEGTPPAGQHVVVVSHRPRPDGWHPEASYHFTGDVAQAVATARELAGERRRRAGPRAGPGGRGGDGCRAGGIRVRQAVFRAGGWPAPAGGPRRGDPGRPGAAPALPGSPLTARGGNASAGTGALAAFHR